MEKYHRYICPYQGLRGKQHFRMHPLPHWSPGRLDQSDALSIHLLGFLRVILTLTTELTRESPTYTQIPPIYMSIPGVERETAFPNAPSPHWSPGRLDQSDALSIHLLGFLRVILTLTTVAELTRESPTYTQIPPIYMSS